MTRTRPVAYPPLSAEPTTRGRERAACEQATTGSGRVGPTRWPASRTPSTTSTATGVLTYVNAAGRGDDGPRRGGHARAAASSTRSPACGARVRREDVRRRAGRRAARGSFEYLHERWDHWFEMRAYPDSRGLAVFVRDVDERRARATGGATPRRASSPPSWRPCPSATVLVDDDGRILTANRAWVAERRAAAQRRRRARRRGRRLPGGDGARARARATTPTIAAGHGPPPGRTGRRPGRRLRPRVLGPARRRTRRWFRLQAARVEGSPAGRRHPHRRHRPGARASRRWPGRPATTS